MRPARVLVINRAADTGRLWAFVRRWEAVAPGQPYEVLEAVDDPDNPARGLYASHLAALGSGPGPVLILEDDVVFADSFSLDLPDPPPGWFLLRLGGLLRTAAAPLGRPAAPSGPWTPVGLIHHTHAYVANIPAALAALLAARPGHDIGAAMMFALPGHYRLTPATVGQAAGQSTVAADRQRPADQFWE